MAQSYVKLQVALMRDYYKNFSKYAKGRPPQKKVAWVTSFTPIEILESLDIEYIYPESYAAVIAASGKAGEMLCESKNNGLCADCCSYSSCFDGALSLGTAPRGNPPMPDILIATNNQCNTLPNWWSMLSEQYKIPLVVLDYPGETDDTARALSYVNAQHKDLISRLEDLSGNKLDINRLSELINTSEKSVAAWKKMVDLFPLKDISPLVMFDGISHLITSRCKPETAELYEAMGSELEEKPPADTDKPAVFWLGYPLWYHPRRYLEELMTDFRVCGSNYITWWNLDYSGNEPLGRLFNAYNYTFLNLGSVSRKKRLDECIRASGAVGVVSLRNKSCKCDFVSAKDISLPQAEIEIDMVDGEYLDMQYAKQQIEILHETICTR